MPPNNALNYAPKTSFQSKNVFHFFIFTVDATISNSLSVAWPTIHYSPTVKVEKRSKKNKSKKLKLKKEKNVKAEGEVGRNEELREEEGVKDDERKKAGLQKVSKMEERDENHGMLLYNSKPEDRLWADGGMVAKVVSGDSSLSLQQRVEDAGFTNVVVTPMGGDRVFLYCTGGEDIWKVFNDAVHFFGMLFSELHKWTSEDYIYERGRLD